MLYTTIENSSRLKFLKRKLRFHAKRSVKKAHTGENTSDILFAGQNSVRRDNWERVYKDFKSSCDTVPEEIGKCRVLYLRGDYLLMHDYLTDPVYVDHMLNNYTEIDRDTFIFGCKTQKNRDSKKRVKAKKPTSNARFVTVPRSEVYSLMDNMLRNPYISIDNNAFDFDASKLDKINPHYFITLRKAPSSTLFSLKITSSTTDDYKKTRGALRGWNRETSIILFEDLATAKPVKPF